MGIQYLNRFLVDNCKKSSIRKTHLRELKYKTIVIDTSIYIYKFIAENKLIENTYLLISLFRHYSITPIFIFDGKPPREKRDLLIQRRVQKQEAEQKYLEMQNILENTSDNEEIAKLQKQIENMKKQCINVTMDDIQSVKQLIEYYGIQYYTAENEADQLIAYLVNSKKAWGCISDDMDMFVYGCSRVFRHLSLLNHTIIMYDTKSILNDLEMSMDEFREITVLSGTDYNIHNKTTLHDTIHWFSKFKKHSKKHGSSAISFYQWLLENTKYITDYDELNNQYQMFIVKMTDFEYLQNMSFKLLPIQKTELRNFLKNYGFIFV
jgi:flap endonuclease-1